MSGINLLQQKFRAKRNNYLYIQKLASEFQTQLVAIYQHLLNVKNPTSKKEHMDLLKELSDKFFTLKTTLTLMSSSSDAVANFEYMIFRYSKDIIDIMKSIGSNKCSNILQMILGNDYKEQVNEHKLLGLYDSIFIPSKFKCSPNSENTALSVTTEKKTTAKCVIMSTKDIIITFYGVFVNDPLNMYKNTPILQKKLTELKLESQRLFLPGSYKKHFMAFLNVEQVCQNSVDELKELMKYYYSASCMLAKKPLGHLVPLFMTGTFEQKRDMIAQLLLSSGNDKKFLAGFVLTVFAESDNEYQSILQSLPWNMQKELQARVKNAKKDVEGSEEDDDPDSKLSYEERISKLSAPKKVKKKANDMLEMIKGSRDGDAKSTKYLEGLLHIPFGKIRKEKIFDGLDEFKDEIGQITIVAKDKNLPEIFCEVLTLETYNHIESSFGIYNDKFKESNSDDLSQEQLEDIAALKDVLEAIKEKWNVYKTSRKDYILGVRQTLDQAVWGHDDAKCQLERIIGQWLNGNRSGEIVGLEGPPGTGKTSLARRGLVNCFPDENGKPRPFSFISLGGSSNGSTLEGHHFTYVGATWGRIVDVLMEAGSMDMIIFFDELDKVSRTEKGQEIIGILTHLTDVTQNSEFNDRYFDGVPIDLSKVLFVFSYNDYNLIDPILRDRITNIKTTTMTLDDKLQVTQRFLIPEILEKLGYRDGDLTLTDEQIKYLINTYTYEAGVRKLKEKLFMIFREYNLRRIYNDAGVESNAITTEFIEELFRGKPKMVAKKIIDKPRIGMMTGLYATTMGIGGIIPIECFKSVADQKLQLVLTGQQGEVMQESMKCARTIAWGLLSKELQQLIRKDWQENGTWGLHLHCPEAAMPKDGPSAGGAITIAILSQLAGIKIHNYVGMTGEIQLNGTITAIGGLPSKLEGAKRAGVKLVLIPQENFQDLQSLRDADKSPEDENFKVIAVSRVEEANRHAMVSVDTLNLTEECDTIHNDDINSSAIDVEEITPTGK